MVMGKDGDLALSEVQRERGELKASLDEEADVMLHVNSEKSFAASVRVYGGSGGFGVRRFDFAAWSDDGCPLLIMEFGKCRMTDDYGE